MAEPNPKIVNSRPSVPEGDDNYGPYDLPHSVARDAGVSVPAQPDADDIIHLNSLEKNAPVSSGDTDNFDVAPAIQGNNFPVDRYKSKGNLPPIVPLS